jgi:hypothetical protein
LAVERRGELQLVKITRSSAAASTRAVRKRIGEDRARLIGAVEHFEQITRPDDRLRSDLRVVERALRRVNQRLGV